MLKYKTYSLYYRNKMALCNRFQIFAQKWVVRWICGFATKNKEKSVVTSVMPAYPVALKRTNNTVPSSY